MDEDEQAGLVEKAHSSRYNESSLGSHIAYHFLIGKDGTVKQNRSLTERTGHTRNQVVNLESIAIAVAGNFEIEHPTDAQMQSITQLIARLDSLFHFEKIIGHREASPTACPGKYLMEALENTTVYWDRPKVEHGEPWSITRYYTPVPGQLKYYRKTYEEDFQVNCSGDCFVTSDGTRLTPDMAFKVAACPPEMPFGTKIDIQGIGTVTCHDRGGAIKDKRIDVWAGVGMDALRRMKEMPGGILSVTIHQ
jgi:3D (Asp-Asp-Asp) domain-containing protein